MRTRVNCPECGKELDMLVCGLKPRNWPIWVMKFGIQQRMPVNKRTPFRSQEEYL